MQQPRSRVQCDHFMRQPRNQARVLECYATAETLGTVWEFYATAEELSYIVIIFKTILIYHINTQKKLKDIFFEYHKKQIEQVLFFSNTVGRHS